MKKIGFLFIFTFCLIFNSFFTYSYALNSSSNYSAMRTIINVYIKEEKTHVTELWSFIPSMELSVINRCVNINSNNIESLKVSQTFPEKIDIPYSTNKSGEGLLDLEIKHKFALGKEQQIKIEYDIKDRSTWVSDFKNIDRSLFSKKYSTEINDLKINIVEGENKMTMQHQPFKNTVDIFKPTIKKDIIKEDITVKNSFVFKSLVFIFSTGLVVFAILVGKNNRKRIKGKKIRKK